MRLAIAALLAFAACIGAARAEVPVPPLKARVTDLTGTLSEQQKGELEARIAAFESRRGSQIAVLLLPTTKPEEIEQYSIRVAEAWKIGRRKVDDGLILLVAKDDRRLRIEVGYGLEGAIPDSVARRVIDERITPRFKAGDFYGGIRDGVEQLIRLAEGETLAAPRHREAASQELGFRSYLASNPAIFMMFAIFFTGLGGALLKAALGRLPGSLATGAALGILGWLAVGAGIAIVAAIFGFIFAYMSSGTSGGWSSGGSSGGSWGGSSSSSSSSSGGFSGGGGSFGGGGSSGSW